MRKTVRNVPASMTGNRQAATGHDVGPGAGPSARRKTPVEGPVEGWTKREEYGKAMADVIRLPARDRKSARVFFTRAELNQLLSMYSRRVMTGEWRDYAIDHGSGRSIFAVFRHAAEHPLYSISKVLQKNGKRVFVVTSGRECLRRSESLPDALAVIDRKMRLVSRA